MSDGHTLLMGTADTQKNSSICLQCHHLAVLFFFFFTFDGFVFVLRSATKTKKVQRLLICIVYGDVRSEVCRKNWDDESLDSMEGVGDL